MTHMRKSVIVSLLAGLIALAAAGCGATAPAAPASASGAPAAPAAAPIQSVTLRLPWIASGYDAPFVVAAQRGYYRQAGFDVKIGQGKGSAITGQTVANGSDTFGVDDAGTTALLISKGVPLKVVAVYVQKSPMAFIYDKSHPFSSPKDLIGRLVVTSAGNAALSVLPAVLATAGVQPSQIKITTIQPQSFATELKTHPSAVVLGVSLSDYVSMHKLDPNAAYKLYADFGPNVYSFGLITSLKEIAKDPQGVAKFVRATDEGWAYAQKHPNQAVRDLVKQFPDTEPALGLQGLEMAFGLLHTPATANQPLGWMAKSDWQQSIQILQKYGNLGSVKPLDDYYTNAFIPKS